MVLADADIDRIAGAAVEGLQKLMAPLPGGLTQAQHEAIAKGLHAVELPDKAGMRPAEATALAFEEKGTTPRSGGENSRRLTSSSISKRWERLWRGWDLGMVWSPRVLGALLLPLLRQWPPVAVPTGQPRAVAVLAQGTITWPLSHFLVIFNTPHRSQIRERPRSS